MAKILIYQLYPLAWPSIREMTKHLARIKELGVDYVWLSPVYSSPRYDHGYDIEDYYSVDIRLGSMADFDAFVETAHGLGIKVLMDLVLNHTSTNHRWFTEYPDYYIWSEHKNPKWSNLFGGDSVWEFDRNRRMYYLHLFHPKQADLNWFPDGSINWRLIREFQGIIRFWTKKHSVDGFRLDVPQAINKNMFWVDFEMDDLYYGDKATQVINHLFPPEQDNPFLIAECFDPSYGDLVGIYTGYTAVSLVDNVMLKEVVRKYPEEFEMRFKTSCKHARFLLSLESHDAPRFTSASGMSPEEIIWRMFNSEAKAICLYQGQELGLSNPTKQELPDNRMVSLDAQTLLLHLKGSKLDELRPYSRANARVSLPMAEYERQMQDPSSYFNLTKIWVERWRQL